MQSMVSDAVRSHAQENPDAFRRIAKSQDDSLQDQLLDVLHEEQSTSARDKVPADD